MSTNGILDFQNTNKIIFSGSDSNVVIDTSNVSLGIGIQGTETPGSNLHVVGNAFISSDLTVSGDVTVSNVNMLHTSNTAALKVNSNVVAEFPRSKKLIKYPRVALTSDAQTELLGYEGYIVSQHSDTKNGTSNRQAWAFFDTEGSDGTSPASPHLDASGARYDSNGDYTGGDSLGGVSGDWVYIRLPDKIQLQSVDLWARITGDRNPVDATVLGSLNGTNWSVIDSWTGAGFTAGKSTSFTINSIQYYDYIGFVFEKIEAGSSGLYVNFHEIDLYGTPEYDPEAHGVDVTIKSVPNVPNTDWLEVYYDGQDYTSDTDFAGAGGVDNKTGVSTYDATTTSSVGFDSTYKAFTFDGIGDYITGTHGLTVPGQPIHSQCVWFKTTGSTGSHQYISVIGTTSPTNQASLLLRDDGKTLLGAYYGGDRAITTITQDVWYHAALVYTGTTTDAAKYYVNGMEVSSTTEGGAAPITPTITGTTVKLGANTDNGQLFKGSIANFRLFNRALSSDEIYQLYAYQKEDFGLGDLSMTLKAGNLHIDGFVGTSRTGGLIIPSGTTDDLPTGVVGMIRYNNVMSKLQVHNGSNWLTVGGVNAIGGTVTNAAGYTIHTFTSSGSLIVTSGGEVDYLVVAGGGGAGSGGGGAGGMLTGKIQNLTASTYTITVGAGGAGGGGGAGAGGQSSTPTNGTNSIAIGITATGGGRGGGGTISGRLGSNGGSGGGHGYDQATSTRTTGMSGQGNGGGRATSGGLGGAGGGGGAGTAGYDGGGGNPAIYGGNGGDGLQSSINGTNIYYAGGGGGGLNQNNNITYNRPSGQTYGGFGGAGGGGTGTTKGWTSTVTGEGTAKVTPTPGTPNTGGGGGGTDPELDTVGPGGTGIVIIRYLS